MEGMLIQSDTITGGVQDGHNPLIGSVVRGFQSNMEQLNMHMVSGSEENSGDADDKSIAWSVDTKLVIKTDPLVLTQIGLSPRATSNLRVTYADFNRDVGMVMLKKD
ncbi:hypothetical protein LguiB_036352 [Lonicera macranthoides]